jgi:phage tail protein X
MDAATGEGRGEVVIVQHEVESCFVIPPPLARYIPHDPYDLPPAGVMVVAFPNIASDAWRRLADFDHVTVRSRRSVTAPSCVCRDEGKPPVKRMSHTKRLTLSLGIIALGICAALPFRRTVSPETTWMADAANNQLSLGEGVSLQMPGQTMSAPLQSKPPAPWTVEGEQNGEQPMAGLPADANLAAQTNPPALPDQYHPLFKPALASDNSGRVVPPGGRQTPPRKPVKTHTIHDGDTLESLAVRYLGDVQRAGDILAANRDVLSDPQLLPIGVAIVIPPNAAVVAGDPAGSAVEDDAPRLVPLPTGGFRRGR